MWTEDEKRKIGIEVGHQIDKIMGGYPNMNNQEVMEVLGIALFWLMSFIYVTSEAAGGSDRKEVP